MKLFRRSSTRVRKRTFALAVGLAAVMIPVLGAAAEIDGSVNGEPGKGRPTPLAGC